MLAEYFQSYGMKIVGEAGVRMLFGSFSFNIGAGCSMSLEAVQHPSGTKRSRSKAETPTPLRTSVRREFWQTDQSQTSSRVLAEIGNKTSTKVLQVSSIINV